jgi:hypothetical protein
LPLQSPPLLWRPQQPSPTRSLRRSRRSGRRIVHNNACGELNDAELRYGVGSDEAEDVFERGGPACDADIEAAWELARVQPTTLAGVIAVLRFANELEDRGMEWPDTDMVGREGWHYQLRATMAAAIEAMTRRGA